MTARPRAFRVLVPLLLVPLFAACADDAGDATPGSTSVAAADVEFAQMMIPHHEQAIEMAEIALDPTVGASAEVTGLATRIRDAQDGEIDQMKGWLAAWGEPEMAQMEDHDMSSMTGMMSAEDMERLAASTGAEFDARWLEMMILHHEGAVEMADTVLSAGTDPEVRLLAEAIIAAQTAEIAEMETLLGG